MMASGPVAEADSIVTEAGWTDHSLPFQVTKDRIQETVSTSGSDGDMVGWVGYMRF